MPRTHIDWTPVYNYGCGWTDCPQCGPMIALEREAKHRKKVASSYPRSTPAEQVSEWLGEAYGTAGERAKGQLVSKKPPITTKEERKLALAERDRAREKVLVVRSLANEDLESAHERLKVAPLRRAYLRRNARGKLTRTEWKTEVWLQLLNPSALIAHREASMSIEKKVARAILRAQKGMNAEGTRISRELVAAGAAQ